MKSEVAKVLNELYPGEWPYQLIAVSSPSSSKKNAGKSPLNKNWTKIPQMRKKRGDSPKSVISSIANHVAKGGNIGLVVPMWVIVLDADDAVSAAYIKALSEFAPVQRTSRGAHVMFRLPAGMTVTNRTGVEIAAGVTVDIRAAGSQIVVSPSVSWSGATYEWELQLPERIDELPMCPDHVLKAVCLPTNMISGTSEVSVFQDVSETSDVLVVDVEVVREKRASEIQTAILATQPKKVGQRIKMIFQYARRLGVFFGRNAKPSKLKPEFRRWWNLAVDVIGTKEWDASWASFLASWRDMKYVYGEGLDQLAKRAIANPDPMAIYAHEECGFENKGSLDLLALCCEMGIVYRGNPFHLSCGLAGKLVGVSADHAHKLLKAFCVMEVLREVEKGEQKPGGRATTYQFIGLKMG